MKMKKVVRLLVSAVAVVMLMAFVAAQSGVGFGDTSPIEAGKNAKVDKGDNGDNGKAKGKGGPGLRWNGIN